MKATRKLVTIIVRGGRENMWHVLKKKKLGILALIMVATSLLVTACGVPQEDLDAIQGQLQRKNAELANLQAQLASSQQDAKYWTQLTSVFMPVAAKLPLMSDHSAFMTPGGLIVALHYDNMNISRAQNLNWLAIGVPGKFTKADQERIEKLYGVPFTHFHDLMADTHGGPPGVEGVWFVHIAVREFDAPWGQLKPGIDSNFMPTPPSE